MVLSRAGNFLYRAGWVFWGLLLFDFPPTIAAYSGFVSRLTNIDEAVETGFLCTAIACLSWVAGRAMANVLARLTRVKTARVRKPQRLPSDRYIGVHSLAAHAANLRSFNRAPPPRCADGPHYGHHGQRLMGSN